MVEVNPSVSYNNLCSTPLLRYGNCRKPSICKTSSQCLSSGTHACLTVSTMRLLLSLDTLALKNLCIRSYIQRENEGEKLQDKAEERERRVEGQGR